MGPGRGTRMSVPCPRARKPATLPSRPWQSARGAACERQRQDTAKTLNTALHCLADLVAVPTRTIAARRTCQCCDIFTNR